jgi:hypothetical protein
VGPTGAADEADAEGLLFPLEGAPAGGGGCGGAYDAAAAAAGRDLSVEATILDVADIVQGPPGGRDPLRGLRRAVSARVAAAGAGAPAGAATASLPGAGCDPLAELAEALAEVLEGTGASVAVRAPQSAARPAAGSPRAGGAAAVVAKAADTFVLRGRFIVIRGATATAADAFGALRPGSPGPRRGDDGIIVDPGFREAFRAAPCTPGYARLVDALPPTFVGDAAALRRLVALVTAQAARSYEALGLSVPPWRRYSAMLARWLPPAARFTDTPVSPPGSPLARLGSEEASALAAATANAAARGAFARLAPRGVAGGDSAAGDAPAPARVVHGFDLPPHPRALAAAVN